MIPRQHAFDDRHAHLAAALPDDVARPPPYIAGQNLVTIFCSPDDMITMVEYAVRAEIVSGHSLLLKTEELDRIISEERLNADETKAFVDNAFRDGAIPATGTAITKILPPVSRFSKDNNHSEKKQTVLDKLAAFFERYFGLV